MCWYTISFSQCSHHPPMLQWLLSNQLNCKPDDILDFELFLADHQPAVSITSFVCVTKSWFPLMHTDSRWSFEGVHLCPSY